MSQQRTWTRGDLPVALDRGLKAAIERGARAPMVLRLTEIAGYTDWGLLLSARSERQVRGIVEGITEELAKLGAENPDEGMKLIGSDGLDLYLWALLDYGDFLIHVFYHPVRRHYDLESMWSDAPRVELGLPQEILDDSDLDGLAVPDPMPNYRGDMAFGGFDDEFPDDEFEDDEDDPEFVDDDLFNEGAPPPAGPTRDAHPDDDLFES